MSAKPKGDSAFRTRLLEYLARYGFHVKRINKIRDNVYMIQSQRRTYFFKGFSSERKYQSQKALTKLLRKKGFYKTYRFLFDIPPLKYKGYYYGFIEYLKPHKDQFRYDKRKNRTAGLRLLQELHRATGKIVKDESFAYPIFKFNQVSKSAERLEEFESNAHIIANYVPETIIKKTITCGRWALRGLKQYERYLNTEPEVIVHGDVAHHNFLRVHSGELYLIDWDLISRAPAIIDYLQYANRILPSMNFSSKELWSYEAFKKLRENPAFLYGLGFPSDIFREWNRLVREDLLDSQQHVHSVSMLTIKGFDQRINFTKDLEQRIIKLRKKKRS